MRPSILPLAVLLWPLAEIAGFVIVGKAVGLWATLALVVLSAAAGAVLLRIQGTGILRRISDESRNGGVPSRDLVHGAMVVIAAFLLMLPGFITGVLGLLLFIPPVRDLAWTYLSRRIVILGSASPFGRGPQGDRPNGESPRPRKGGPVVDLDADDFQRDPNPGSPWAGGKRLGDQ